MKRLEISLFGLMNVTLDGEYANQFEADSARALLAYLVMHPGINFPREALSDLLWPEHVIKSGLANLRQTLLRVRRAIQDEQAAPSFLIITRQTIQFNPDSDYWLDVSEFTSLLSTTKSHPHRRLEACPLCMQRLEKAARLYRGDFMDGFNLESLPFQEWLTIQREEIRRQVIFAFRHLTHYFTRRENYDQAEDYARRQIALEPWNEEAHQQLMRALALSGQRSAAIAQYEICRHNLKQSLGIVPSPLTTELDKRIREGRLTRISGKSAARYNLPPQLTTFIGRETEMTQLTDWLVSTNRRLVSIIGPGGVGKTRLALECAQFMSGSFNHGVWFVPLDGVEAPAPDTLGPYQDTQMTRGLNPVVMALAEVFDLSLSGDRTYEEQVLNYLRPKEILLLFDGFESLLEPGLNFILKLLHFAPRASILVTSRQRLSLQAENVLQLTGLSVPNLNELPTSSQFENGEKETEITRQPSLQLFTERARRVKLSFDLNEETLPGVVQVCRVVEGLPLGIELAAAWIGILTPNEIAQAIQQDLDNLSTTQRDLPKRHQSIRAVFESSWKLLSTQERSVLARLSVFRSGFDRQAAEQVASASPAIIASLQDKSLLQTSAGGQLSMHELLRQFAAEKLDFDDFASGTQPATNKLESTIHDLHSAYYLGFLAQHEEALKRDQPRIASIEIQSQWENIQAAWQWAVSNLNLEDLHNSLPALSRFLDLKGLFEEGKHLLVHATGRIKTLLAKKDQPELQAQIQELLSSLLLAQAALSERMSEYALAGALCQEALAIAVEAGNMQQEIAAKILLAKLYYLQGELHAARSLAEYLLAIPGLNTNQLVALYLIIGQVHQDQGRLAQAEDDFEKALSINQQSGNAIEQAKIMNRLAGISYFRGEVWEALQYSLPLLELSRSLGDRLSEANYLSNLGLCYLDLGDTERSQIYIQQALALSRQMGDQQEEAENLILLAQLRKNLGDLRAALKYAQQAQAQFAAMGRTHLEMETLPLIGEILLEKGNLLAAAEAQRSALGFFGNLQRPDQTLRAQAGLAQIALTEGHLPDALSYVEKILPSLEVRSKNKMAIPLSVHLVCFQVLEANQDSRAVAVLKNAHNLLKEREARIGNIALRRSFMENIPAHHALMDAYQAD